MAFFFPLRAAAHESHISHPEIHRGGQLCLKQSLVKDHNPGSVAFLQKGSMVLEEYPSFPLDVKICHKHLVNHLQQEEPASEKLLIY